MKTILEEVEVNEEASVDVGDQVRVRVNEVVLRHIRNLKMR